MSSSAARQKRRIKRANKFGRTLVTADDLSNIMWMPLNDAIDYCNKRNLVLRIVKVDGQSLNKTPDQGPNAITVNVDDCIISKAETKNQCH